MSHPDHDCEDYGITHMAYSGHVEYARKQNQTRNILIIIACLSLISIPLGFTVFDLVKYPSMLDSNIDYSLFDAGYDIVCFSDYGMQYCVMKKSESNRIAYDSDRLVLQSVAYPCLNANISTPEITNDIFLVTDGIQCVGSLEFPIIDGWSWNSLSDEMIYSAGKYDTTFWWNDLFQSE